MPLPAPMQPGGLGGAFGMLGAIAGPVMMIAIAMQKPGPVRTLGKAGADSPDRARRPATLGLQEAPLVPLIRAGVIVREHDGRIWLDRTRARRRQWRVGFWIGCAVLAASGLLALLVSL